MKRIITTSLLISYIALAGVFMLFNSKSYSQSQGAFSPVWVLNHNLNCYSCPGSDWNAINNIEEKDNTFSTSLLLPSGSCSGANCYFSEDLTPSDYGFYIPSNTIITGINIQIYKEGSAVNAISDSVVQLISNGNPVGNNLALNGTWTTANDLYTYGGSNELWGFNWTPSLINDINFGVLFKSKNISSSQQTASVDWIGVTVYYSTATGTESVSSFSFENLSIQYNSLENNLILKTNFSESIPNSSLTVYDLLGQVQFKKEVGSIEKGNVINTISANTLRPGIYLVELEAGSKKVLKKLIVAN